MVVSMLYLTGRRVVCSDGVHSAWLALNHEFSVDSASPTRATAALPWTAGTSSAEHRLRHETQLQPPISGASTVLTTTSATTRRRTDRVNQLEPEARTRALHWPASIQSVHTVHELRVDALAPCH